MHLGHQAAGAVQQAERDIGAAGCRQMQALAGAGRDGERLRAVGRGERDRRGGAEGQRGYARQVEQVEAVCARAVAIAGDGEFVVARPGVEADRVGIGPVHAVRAGETLARNQPERAGQAPGEGVISGEGVGIQHRSLGEGEGVDVLLPRLRHGAGESGAEGERGGLRAGINQDEAGGLRHAFAVVAFEFKQVGAGGGQGERRHVSDVGGTGDQVAVGVDDPDIDVGAAEILEIGDLALGAAEAVERGGIAGVQRHARGRVGDLAEGERRGRRRCPARGRRTRRSGCSAWPR